MSEVYKVAQQIAFEYGDQLGGKPNWAPLKEDEHGFYLPCFECGHHVRREDLDKIKYSDEKTTEQLTRGSAMSDEESNLITVSFQNMRNVPTSMQGVFKDLINKGPKAFFSGHSFGSNITDNYVRLVNDTLRPSTGILKKYQFTMDTNTINELWGQIRQLLTDVEEDTGFENYWDTEEDGLKVMTAICAAANNRLQNLAPLVDKCYDIISKSFGSNQLTHRKIKYKYPLCNNCQEEMEYCCEVEDCEECSLDEDEFVEVEDSKYEDDVLKKETKIYCKERHGAECERCDGGILLSDDEHVEHDGDHYHRDCFYEVFRECEECGSVEYMEDMMYDDESYRELCQNCHANTDDREDGIESEVDRDKLNHFINVNEGFKTKYPLDAGIIQGNILPVLNNAKKKFLDWDDKVYNWILKRIQKPDAKAAVQSVLESEGKDAIEIFEDNLGYLGKLKQKYPQLKGYRPIPVDVNIEKPGWGHGGTVLAVYPNDATLKWADSIIPGASFIYNKILSKLGHHSGALGYARLSESNGNIIVDNLQTDLDKQNSRIKTDLDNAFLTEEHKDANKELQNLYAEIRNNGEKKARRFRELKTEIDPNEKEDIKKEISFFEERIKELTEKSDDLENKIKTEEIPKYREELGGFSRKQLEKALNWWFKAIDKFYAPFLLDTVKNFASENNQEAYLTPFEMQQEKWPNLPDRNKDIYDRLPEMMGMRGEDTHVKPEDLRYKEWRMWRVAKDLEMLSKLFYKKASK